VLVLDPSEPGVQLTVQLRGVVEPPARPRQLMGAGPNTIGSLTVPFVGSGVPGPPQFFTSVRMRVASVALVFVRFGANGYDH